MEEEVYGDVELVDEVVACDNGFVDQSGEPVVVDRHNLIKMMVVVVLGSRSR